MDVTRRRILEAAGPRFASKGFDATTVRELTVAAGVNLAAVNYHFRSKEELYVEAVRLAAQSCETSTPMPDLAGLDPPEALRHFIRTLVTRMCRDDVPEWHRELIMRELAQPRCGATEVFVEGFVRPSFAALQAVLLALLPPDVPRDDLALLGNSIVAQCLHYHHARNVVPLLVGSREFAAYSIDRLTDHVWRFSMAGIRGLHPDRRRRTK